MMWKVPFMLVLLYYLTHYPLYCLAQGQIKGVPEAFIRPIYGQVDTLHHWQHSGKFWQVFALANHPNKKIQFQQAFYVIDVRKDSLHLIGPQTGNPFEDIGPNGQILGGIDYGWVNRNQLLCWNHCLVNDCGTSRKAFYHPPQKELELYHIFLERKDSILISPFKQIPYQLTDSTSSFFWVDKASTIIWESNLAIQVNQQAAALEERQQNNTKVSIWVDQATAWAYKAGKIPSDQKTIWMPSLDKKEQVQKWKLTFPIMQQQSGLVKVVAWHKHKSKKKDPFAFTYGFTTTNIINQQHAIFQTVTLLSRLELAQLLQTLRLLSDEVIRGGNHQKMQEVWLKLMKQKVDIPESEILEYRMGAINCEIFGVTGGSPLLNKLKLKYIGLPEYITKEKYQQYLDQLVEKHKKLSELFNRHDEIEGISSFQTTYYWVPIDYLP